MGLIEFIRSLTSSATENESETFWAVYEESKIEYSARDLAFRTAVGKIADALAKSEVRTYRNGDDEKKLDWYRFNYAPNRNTDGGMWMRQIISRLYEKNEALILDVNEDLLVAKSFGVKKSALSPWAFEDVTVEGFKFDKLFHQGSDCIYLQLNDQDIRSLLKSMYLSYTKLMKAARDLMLVSGGVKGVLAISGTRARDPKGKEIGDDILNQRIEPLWKNRNAVIPLESGFSYQDLNKEKGWEGSRDYRAMIDDIYDLTAAAFGIPPIVLKGQDSMSGGGTTYDAAYNIFLTDAVGSPKEILETAFTRYLYNKNDIMKGSKVVIDTSTIKHFDLFGSSSAIEKLVGSGALTINEVRKKLGLLPTDDKVGNIHLVTKNFGVAEDMAATAETREEGEEND